MIKKLKKLQNLFLDLLLFFFNAIDGSDDIRFGTGFAIGEKTLLSARHLFQRDAKHTKVDPRVFLTRENVIDRSIFYSYFVGIQKKKRSSTN